MKIVSDSSANIRQRNNLSYASVPMRVVISGREYIDTPELDVPEMMQAMDASKEKTSTACPGIGDFLEAFGDEEEILVLTLTGTLSGCFSAASVAAEQYMEQYPGRRVEVIDTLSTGPEMELIIGECEKDILEGRSFDEVCANARSCLEKTGLIFLLASLDNFARNGRVSPALAKLVGVLNIHIVGRASSGGELEPLKKVRGEKKAVQELWNEMKAAGYAGGKVRIRHTDNKKAAVLLIRLITEEYPDADVKAGANRGLCSYYADHGGMLVGYEKEDTAGVKTSRHILQAFSEKVSSLAKEDENVSKHGLIGKIIPRRKDSYDKDESSEE